MIGHIAALYTYPVKGLSPAPLEAVDLTPGEAFPWDRAFAIENGTRLFDEAAPRHLPKTKFFMLARQERLAELATRFDPATRHLTVQHQDRIVLEANLSDTEGRQAVEAFFDRFMQDEAKGPARLVRAPGFSFSDVPAKCLSIINLASVRALEEVIGKPIDPMRFRANIYVEGLEPWADHKWVEKDLRIGDIKARGLLETTRCPATNVDPARAVRDLDIPDTLREAFGHTNLGLYVNVETTGSIGIGDEVALA